MTFRTLQECIDANRNVEKNPRKYCSDHFPELSQKYSSDCPKLPMGTVKEMIKTSRACIKKHPQFQNHKNACEVGLIPSKNQNFTLHTHTHKAKIDYPSPKDIQTTLRWNKEVLCIAEAVTGRLVCFSSKDRFKKPICDKKVI